MKPTRLTPHASSLRFRLVLSALFAVSALAAIQNQILRGTDPQRLWALIIGISNYAHAEPLQYAASDARAFSDFLQSPRGGAVPEDHFIRLIEDQATRTAILLALDSIQEKVQGGDSVYIYLAGHGYLRHRSGYFIPSDGDMRSASASAVSFAQLKDMIESGLAQAGTRVLITDVCHSGRVGTEPTALARKIENLINQEFLNLSGGGNRTFLNLLASRPSEASYERDDLGQGVFTHTLLEALNGRAASPGAPVVDAQRVVDYVRSEVPKFTAGQQHPIANQDYDPSLPLSYLDRPGPAAKLTLGGAVLEIIHGDKSAYVRVQWVDPKTDAVTVRPLPRDRSSIQIGSLVPGDLRLRFFDDQNRPREASVKVAPGRNTLDLISAGLVQGPRRGRLPGYLASLAPLLPSGTARSQSQSDSATEARDAVLLMRLDRSVQVYVDDTYFGDSEGSNRFLQLAGLTPGTHKVRLISSPERERRFRVKLVAGKQILDPPTGELRFAAEVPPPSQMITAAPATTPPDARVAYNRFVQAVWEERLIEPVGDSAWDSYQALSSRLPPGIRERIRDSLVVAMGDRAQRIILKYLRGGDIRWNATVFEEGARLIARVRELFKTTPDYESKQSFFSGRALIENGQYAQAIQELQRSISLDPEAGHAHNAIGLAYWKQDLLDSAIPAFQQAITLSPRWTYPRITLALIYLEQRRYQDSEKTFREALQIDGEDTAAHNGLAQLHYLLGRLPEAENSVQRAIDFDPGNAYAYETLGKIRQEQRRDAEAEEAYRLAIRLEPDEPSFQVSLQDLLRRVGRLQEVQQIFARIVDRYQDSLQVIQAYTGFLEEQYRTGEVETIFNRAVDRLPKNANLRVLYGGFLRRQGRDRDAEEQLRTALRIAPGNGYAHHDLALLALARKQVANAEKEVALAIKADPRLASPHKLLAAIRFAQKRHREALQEYREAMNLSIDANQRQELQEEIAKTEAEVVGLEIETAAKHLSEGKSEQAWRIYCETLKAAPDSKELRDAVLRFHASHPSSADLSILPPGTLPEVLKTGYWRAQQRAEDLWKRGEKAEAIRAFRIALAGLDSLERRVVASTSFNLSNETYGVHALVHRWALRAIDEQDYRGALELMEAAVQQMIFAPLPGFDPLTIESLMVRPDLANPKSVRDYDIAHHADRRAHEVYAAALAAAGDIEGARRYLIALEAGGPDLRARLLVTKALQSGHRWTEAVSVLKEALDNPRLVWQPEPAAEAYILLSESQCRAGDCGAARDTLQAARRLLPGNKQIEAAVKKLK